MTDETRAGDLAEVIRQCDSIMAALEDLGVDGDDLDFHHAVGYTENAREQVKWLRQEFTTARAAITPAAPAGAPAHCGYTHAGPCPQCCPAPTPSASVAPQPEEIE